MTKSELTAVLADSSLPSEFQYELIFEALNGHIRELDSAGVVS